MEVIFPLRNIHAYCYWYAASVDVYHASPREMAIFRPFHEHIQIWQPLLRRNTQLPMTMEFFLQYRADLPNATAGDRNSSNTRSLDARGKARQLFCGRMSTSFYMFCVGHNQQLVQPRKYLRRIL
jgi:hypothetical protein